MNGFLNEFFLRNKKKIIIGGSLLSYLIYLSVKNYDKTKTLFLGIYNIAKSIYNGKFFEEENEKFKLSEKNENQFKIFSLKLIEDKLKITEIKNNIQIKKNKELISTWEIFKNKILISFYSYIIIVKFLSLISITNISIMNKLIEKQMITYINSLEMLNEIWEIIEKSCKDLLEKIDKILNEKVEKILLKKKLKFENLNTLILELLENILSTIQINEDYLNKIENKISDLDSNDYDINNTLTEKIDEKLKFYTIYYDIIYSNYFQLTIQELIRQEVNNNILILKEKIQNEEKSIAQIILLIDEIKISIIEKLNKTQESNSDFFIDEISEEYIKSISNIF